MLRHDSMRLIASASFWRFAVVGAGGFAADGAVLLALTHGLGAAPILARAVSFSCALLLTWLFNRVWTFRSRSSTTGLIGLAAQFVRYAAVQLTGGGANILMFAIVVRVLGDDWIDLIAALVAGSAAGLAINYIGAKLFVFVRRAELRSAASTARDGC